MKLLILFKKLQILCKGPNGDVLSHVLCNLVLDSLLTLPNSSELFLCFVSGSTTRELYVFKFQPDAVVADNPATWDS